MVAHIAVITEASCAVHKIKNGTYSVCKEAISISLSRIAPFRSPACHRLPGSFTFCAARRGLRDVINNRHVAAIHILPFQRYVIPFTGLVHVTLHFTKKLSGLLLNLPHLRQTHPRHIDFLLVQISLAISILQLSCNA